MKLVLNEKPQGVTLIQGFPGFGMVGTISTEYLCEHLETREIGKVFLPEMLPMIAIHKGKIVPPISIHYYEKGNMVILNALTKGKNFEWRFVEIVEDLIHQLSVKEVIALEGVAAQPGAQGMYFFTTDANRKKELVEKNYTNLDDGIIMGVSAGLLLKQLSVPLTAFFALTSNMLPDSAAGAEIIKVLDSYLDLSVEYEPLYEQAKVFEDKIKSIMDQSQTALDEKDKMNYMG